jgi:predicted Co/Zn/Cd cation transporter (cation efflux family)
MILAFAAALLLERKGFGWAVPYVDPTLVIALSATVGVLPVWIIIDNLRQIAHMAPESALQDKVQSIISKIVEGQSLKSRDVRIAKLGRLVYLQLYLIASADRPAEVTLSEQDRLRQDLYDLLPKELGNLVFDVIFTTDPVWSARSITSAAPGPHGLAH